MASDSAKLRCTSPEFVKKRMPSDDKTTHSYEEQHKVEETVGNCYLFFRTELREGIDINLPQLHRKRHEAFLLRGKRAVFLTSTLLFKENK